VGRATPRLAGAPAGREAVAPSDQTLPRAVPDTSATAGASAGEVAVHVAGRVRRPGLVRLPARSRVQDAIRAAGGATPRRPRASARPRRRGRPGATPSAPLDLNTATLDQLDTLPGVGEVTANRIIAYRSAHPFSAVDELLEVPGIGQRRLEQLKDLVTVA
jgi:competence protein ComEA